MPEFPLSLALVSIGHVTSRAERPQRRLSELVFVIVDLRGMLQGQGYIRARAANKPPHLTTDYLPPDCKRVTVGEGVYF